MGLFHFGSAGGLGFALLFEIIAISTPGWVYITTNTTMLNITGRPPYAYHSVIRSGAYGLFHSDPPLDTQYGLYLGGTAISVCVCFLCIAMGYLSVGIAANVASGGLLKEKKLDKIGGIMGITAGIFIMIGMACFTGLLFDNPLYGRISGASDCCMYAPYSEYCKTGISPLFGGRFNISSRKPMCSVEYSWGYSYAFGWMVFCISLISGAVGLVGK